MHKVLLSVAPVSAVPHKIIPEEIAQDVCNCYMEGAAMVHLHARDENGKLTADLSVLEETIRRIREKCDIVIEVSTGGVSDLTIEERCQPCFPDYIEANSLNIGSVNLGKAVYQNPIDDVKICVEQILSHRKLPETELFELGMVHTMRKLTEEFDFDDPLLLALVFGHEGELPATRPALNHMLDFIGDEFGPDSFVKTDEEGNRRIMWGYTQAARKDWNMMRYALACGADSLRVGFEDSDYLDPETQVDQNAVLIRRAAELVRDAGYQTMTAEEAREIFHISK